MQSIRARTTSHDLDGRSKKPKQARAKSAKRSKKSNKSRKSRKTKEKPCGPWPSLPSAVLNSLNSFGRSSLTWCACDDLRSFRHVVVCAAPLVNASWSLSLPRSANRDVWQAKAGAVMEQIAAELPKNPDVVKKVNAVFQVFHRFTPDFRTPH